MSQPSHDTQACSPVQLSSQLFDLWETEIVPQFPAQLDEQARVLKAYERHRAIGQASDLLCALLAWVLGAVLFAGLGCWAVLLGIADISEAAWRKRVRRCGDWLQWLLMEVLTPNRQLGVAPAESKGARVILVDGTTLGPAGGNEG